MQKLSRERIEADITLLMEATFLIEDLHVECEKVNKDSLLTNWLLTYIYNYNEFIKDWSLLLKSNKLPITPDEQLKVTDKFIRNYLKLSLRNYPIKVSIFGHINKYMMIMPKPLFIKRVKELNEKLGI